MEIATIDRSPKQGELLPVAGGAATARMLAEASISPATRKAYALALRAWDRWRAETGGPETDEALAAYLGILFDAGKASSSAGMAVAAVRFRARVERRPNPAGEATARTLAGYRRDAAAERRGRGQAAPVTYGDVMRMMEVAKQPRRSGRGTESAAAAERRGSMDVAILGLAFYGGLRAGEISSLLARDVAAVPDAPGLVLVGVRRSKTNQIGDRSDVRVVKNGAGGEVRRLAEAAAPDARLVPLAPRAVGLRITAAARAAGVPGRVTGHSARVALASELIARGASTADVMLAGGWKSARMVAHYAAGATAMNGAVARLL